MKARLSALAGILLAGALVSPILAQHDASRPAPPIPADIGAKAGHIPLVHYVPSRAPLQTSPVWVDASVIVNSDGEINSAFLDADVVKEVEATRTMPVEGGCVQFGEVYRDSVSTPRRTTPEEAIRTSYLAVRGKVTEKRYGFDNTTPGQLLRVEPGETLKGQPRDVPAYSVFVPVGTISIGTLKICKTDNRYPAPPAVGDEVLLFAPPMLPEWDHDPREPLLELEDEGGLIVIGADGHVGLPKRYQWAEPSTTASALLIKLRSQAAATGDSLR